MTRSDIPDMPAADFLRVTKEIAKTHPPGDITVVMTGGEPLVRKDLAEVGLELRRQGFRWGLVTNGWLLTAERLTELLNAGLGAITISLDGPESEHDWLRNHSGSHRKALEAIRLVAKAKRINADVVTCVNQRTIGLLKETESILRDTGIQNWRLFTITPIGRAAGMEELQLNGNQLRQLLDFIQANRMEKRVPRASFSCESYVGPYEGEVRDGFFYCRAGVHIGSILADGGISACPNIDRDLVQGNIYQDDFNTIWEKRFLPFRNRSWTHIHACSACDQYRYCGGNGLHWWAYDRQEMYGCNWLKMNTQDSKK